MSDVIFGRDVIGMYKIGGDWFNIFCATGCSFTFTNELIGKTTVNSGIAREYRARLSDCTASFDGVAKTGVADDVLSPFYFLQEGVRRTAGEYRIVYTDQDGGIKEIAFTGLVKSLALSADINSFATSTLEIQTTGPISLPVTPDPVIECEDVYSVTVDTTPGTNSVTGPWAGYEVLVVYREGTEHGPLVTGTPLAGSRQVQYNGGALTFDPANPFNPGETVTVVWKQGGS